MAEGLAPGGAQVSAREAEVLELLGQHMTYGQIGARLFISARTVESHVTSVRRKLGFSDRTALIRYAAAHGRRQPGQPMTTELPAPLSSFVGRRAEQAALTEALARSRLVSAVGPGGVGKTRLALAVAAEVSARFVGRVWYVDLVPVGDPAVVANAVVASLGLAEPPGSSPEESIVAGLAGPPALLVLDNCEHVADAVAVLVERLLSGCAELKVLVTSRVRLVVPFEHVYVVPGLSVPDHSGDDDGSGGHEGDAVELFVERATAAGGPPLAPEDLGRVAGLCRALDGMALAIELAAARLPSLGFDGLEDGLDDRLALLVGGARAQERHRSLQDTLDWSYQLLGPIDQAVLRRVSVFAAGCTVDAAAAVAGFPPVPEDDVGSALARLTDHNLLVAVPGAGGICFRPLEVVRQYGARRLAADEHETRARHLRWCLTAAAGLGDDHVEGPDTGRPGLGGLVDELRGALGWAAHLPAGHDEAALVALCLAGLLFRQGRLGEAQRRYEQAAALARDDPARARALAQAAAVAKCRMTGDEALGLEEAAAQAHLRAGDHGAAAVAFARAAELVVRFRGTFAEPPPAPTRQTLLSAARAHAHGHPHAELGLLVAEAHTNDLRDPASTAAARKAAEAASRAASDPRLQSAALDALVAIRISQGDAVAAATVGRRRVELLAALPLDPATGCELKDALHVAVMTSLGVGDLPGALRYADQQVRLPYLDGERDLASEELLAPAALAGDWDEVISAAEQFGHAWARGGRPRAPARGIGAAAVAMVHGLCDDDAARAEWLAVVAAIRGVPDHLATQDTGYGETFDAIVLLHQGRPEDAFRRLAPEPGAVDTCWYGQQFRQWHLALRAEAAVLAEHADAGDHIARAHRSMAGNPIATALVQRATGLLSRDGDALVAAAAAFEAAACPYQSTRTRSLFRGLS